MRAGVTAAILAVALFSPLGEARACSTLLPDRAAEVRALRLQFLQRFSDEIVYGRWLETERFEQDGEQVRRGYVSPIGAGAGRFRVTFLATINCGFPRHPAADETGVFFLRASSPDFYLDEDDKNIDESEFYWEILHFESVASPE